MRFKSGDSCFFVLKDNKVFLVKLYSPEQIATFTDKSIGDVKAIIEGKIPATVD